MLISPPSVAGECHSTQCTKGTQQAAVRQRGRKRARQHLQARKHLLVQVHALLKVVAAAGINRELQDVFVVEPRVETSQIPQAANEQTGADEQEDRERDLSDDQKVVERQA